MKRTSVIILGAIVIVIGGLFGLLGLTIINSKDCSQIVIDTNELHSGIDIPDVDYINCYFDKQKKTRLSIYKLKLNGFYLDNYIKNNNFKLVDSNANSRLVQLELDERPKTLKLYQARGFKWNNKWKYVIEKETGKLWVEINYK